MVDALDSKSCVRKSVRVRVPPSAPCKNKGLGDSAWPLVLLAVDAGVHLVPGIVPETLYGSLLVIGRDVGVSKRRGDVLVAHPPLYCPRLNPLHLAMGAEGVAQLM